MRLYRAMFISTFGRDASHPLRTAILRIGFLVIASFGLGMTLASLLPPLPVIGKHLQLLCSCVFITQVFVLAALFASYGIIRPSNDDTFARQLLYWPVRPFTAWLALLIPGGTLSLLAVGLIAPSSYVLFTQLGIGWWAITAAIVLGWASALGIVYGLPKIPWLQAGGALALLGVNYGLLQRMYGSPDNIVVVVVWAVAQCAMLVLFARSAYTLAKEAAIGRLPVKVGGRYIPTRQWFLKKICRGRVTKVGTIVTAAMSIAIGLAAWKLSMTEIQLFSMAIAFLAAALASDVRSLSARRPVEIIGLKGCTYFTVKQFMATALTCAVTVSPLLFAAFFLCKGTNLTDWVMDVGLSYALGVGCGLFASILIAPGPRDITAQSGSTLLATGIFILPQLSAFSQLAHTTIDIMKSTLLVALLVGAAFVEYKRNCYTWRKS